MNRQSFLHGAAAVLTAGGAVLAARGVAVAAVAPIVPISYDAFLSNARAPYKHKQLFTSPRANNGAIFAYIRNSLNGYQFGWGEGPGTLHAAAVLNGVGVAQGVADAGWARYRLADVLAIAGDPVRAAGAQHGNPWAHAPAAFARNDADAGAPFNQDIAIETLQRRNATFFVCDNALRALAMKVIDAGSAGGRSLNELHADLRANLVAGGLLVPAGVTTIDALQQEHFTLYDASV